MRQPIRHPAVQNAANCQPAAIALAVSGEECLFGRIAGMRCCAEPVFCEMTQGCMKYRLAAAIHWIVIGRLSQHHACLGPAQRIAAAVHGGGEMNGHRYETLMLFFWRNRAFRSSF